MAKRKESTGNQGKEKGGAVNVDTLLPTDDLNAEPGKSKKKKIRMAPTTEPAEKPEPEEDVFDAIRREHNELDDEADEVLEPDVNLPKKEEEAKKEEAPQAKPPVHSDRTIRLALHYGITRAEMAGMSKAELLEEIQAAKIEAETIEALESKKKAKEPKKEEPEDDEFSDLESELDPRILKALREGKASAKQLAEFKKEVAERESRREIEENGRKVQEFFKTRPDLFGKGNDRGIQPGTPEYFKRNAVYAQLNYLVQTGQMTTLEDDLQSVTNGLFGVSTLTPETGAKAKEEPEEKAKTPQELELEKRKLDYANGGLAKPTARVQNLPNGKQKALQGPIADFVRRRDALRDDDNDASTTFFDA